MRSFSLPFSSFFELPFVFELPLVIPFFRCFDPFSTPLFLLFSLFLFSGFEGAPLAPGGCFLFLLLLLVSFNLLSFFESVFLLLTFEDFVDEEVFESVDEALSFLQFLLFPFVLGGV